MATELHTFIDIFNSTFSVEGNSSCKVEKIIIPMIQRDYAQGREDSDIQRVRSRFLEALHDAVTGKPITLDFVYGDVRDGVMTPLDGQQRLTTLFLLHWYAAKKNNVPSDEYGFLRQFSYDTRYSARHFCLKLVDFMPEFNMSLSQEIIDQVWFPLEWKKDPTIASMLVMLDAIQENFYDVPELWEKLKNGCISFYFLPIEDMGLTDELYIKMNSRGKPLTMFEHFKAELERELRRVDESTAKRIIRKIDLDWTEMLWRYRGDDNVTDDEFLRYFKFICDVICYHANGTAQGRSYDEFDLLKMYFSSNCPDVQSNIALLENYFDCWCHLDKDTPASLFEKYISYTHEPYKIRIDERYAIDTFEDCLRTYSDITGQRRSFPLNRFVILYAFICFLLNRNSISEEAFARRLRIVNNLIINSEDELSDSEARTSGNRMPAILKQVDNIIITGYIDEAIERSFSPSQLAEETKKINWLSLNPGKAESLFTLEDHYLLHGQISIVGLENDILFDRFTDLFKCDYDKIDCAMMSLGFYPQREHNKWRYQFGTGSAKNFSAWRNLFHISRNTRYDKTHEILIKLLSSSDTFSNEYLDQITKAFIMECETANKYPWRYYYVKYPAFRPGSHGRYWRNSRDCEDDNTKDLEESYAFTAMNTQTMVTNHAYNPFLKIADEAHISRDRWGQVLMYSEIYIICKCSSIDVKWADTKEVIKSFPIQQDEEYCDIENRFCVLNKVIEQIEQIRVDAIQQRGGIIA